LNRIKAARIKTILNQIREDRGSLDIGFLAEMPVPQAKEWLKALPGVGPKTAGCVLLFSLGRPVLPVDTHVHRVSRRLGLLDSKVSHEQAHELLEEVVPPRDIYQFHVNMLAHGRRVLPGAASPMLCVRAGRWVSVESGRERESRWLDGGATRAAHRCESWTEKSLRIW